VSNIYPRTRRLLPPLATVALVAALAAGCGSTRSSGASSQANATDRAFVAQMIPHHEMAIQMAHSAERQGQHAQIKTLAAGIIAAQTREIAQLEPIVNSLGVIPDQVPTATGGDQISADDMGMGATGSHMTADARALGLSMDQMGMSMNTSALDTARPFDRAFVDMMIPHHQGAIRMARAELRRGQNPQLQTIATAIITQQAKEIADMNSWRAAWYGRASPAGGVPAA
jgi:uncharacterized protein (DUF305 family)